MATNFPHTNGMTVVVVEDEAIVRDLTVCELEDTGFDVVEFETADAALPYLRRHGAGLAAVVTDVQMPGQTNGLELADILNSIWPELRVLVTSGGPLVNPAKLPPCANFMPKPWLPADLARRVLTLVTPGRSPLPVL